jgi:hypothetical protein
MTTRPIFLDEGGYHELRAWLRDHPRTGVRAPHEGTIPPPYVVAILSDQEATLNQVHSWLASDTHSFGPLTTSWDRIRSNEVDFNFYLVPGTQVRGVVLDAALIYGSYAYDGKGFLQAYGTASVALRP